VFAASDVTDISVITAAAEQHIRVPDQLSVVGFDDVPLARLSNPPLTTVRQDIQRGAALLVERLCQRLAGEEVGSIQIAPEILTRESS
jgi:DNA-binding LacI/PurR family transcriptional regulator